MQRLSRDVTIEGQPAATVGSVAINQPPHVPTPPGTAFQVPPTNRGTVQTGSGSVLINGQGAARLGDPVATCNDPAPAPTGTVTTGSATVAVG